MRGGVARRFRARRLGGREGVQEAFSVGLAVPTSRIRSLPIRRVCPTAVPWVRFVCGETVVGLVRGCTRLGWTRRPTLPWLVELFFAVVCSAAFARARFRRPGPAEPRHGARYRTSLGAQRAAERGCRGRPAFRDRGRS